MKMVQKLKCSKTCLSLSLSTDTSFLKKITKWISLDTWLPQPLMPSINAVEPTFWLVAVCLQMEKKDLSLESNRIPIESMFQQCSSKKLSVIV